MAIIRPIGSVCGACWHWNDGQHDPRLWTKRCPYHEANIDKRGPWSGDFRRNAPR